MAQDNKSGLSREELAELLEQIEDNKADAPDTLDSPQQDRPEQDDRVTESPVQESSAGESSKQSAPAKQKRSKALLKIIGRVSAALVITSAIVVLIVQFVFPIVRIYGISMGSTITDGDIVIARKTTELKQGDICAFNYGSRVICKRVIGVEGDVIEINDEGVVFVNGQELDEPYLRDRSLGECDVEFPLIVPQDSYFVLSDNRRSSIDSRSTVIGCVSKEQVVGKLVLRILPFSGFGRIK